MGSQFYEHYASPKPIVRLYAICRKNTIIQESESTMTAQLYAILELLNNLEPEYEGTIAIPLQDALYTAEEAIKGAIRICEGDE